MGEEDLLDGMGVPAVEDWKRLGREVKMPSIGTLRRNRKSPDKASPYIVATKFSRTLLFAR